MHSNLEEQENPQIKVWDIGVRIFHWSLVLFYTIAYISEDIELIHVYAGYVVLGLIFFSCAMGADRHQICALQQFHIWQENRPRLP